MDGKSLNLTHEKIAQLKELFPEIFSEGKVDFTRLKEVLGEIIVDPNEHYELSWAGKAEARKEIQKQTTNTLIPNLSGFNATRVNRNSGAGNDSSRADSLENLTGFSGNIFIEGENLEILRILQKAYFGKIKMIYIDPPYNTGNDSFVYPDDYAERLEEYNKRTGVTDEAGFLNKQDLWRKNTKENGQFHSVWLSMMYPRLYLAKNLLRDDGVIFISIDDNEAGNLKLLMDEVFGEENFVGNLIWKSRQVVDSRNQQGLSSDHEYILIYAKNEGTRLRGKEIDIKKYSNPDNDQRGEWMSNSILGLATKSQRPNLHYDFIDPETGNSYAPPPDTGWRYSKETLQQKLSEKRIVFPKDGKGRPREKKFLIELNNEFTGFSSVLSTELGYTLNGTREVREILADNFFQFPKPVKVIKEFIKQGSDEASIILDFFAGSGTTAHAVLELNEEDGGNRKFICVQMPEVLEENSEAYKAGYRTIADISKARITKVIEKLQKTRGEQLPLEGEKQVLGFDSFTITASNFKSWRGDVEGEELLKQLEAFVQSEKDGHSHKNMLVELLLKSGLPLTTKVETLKAGEEQAFYAEEARLFLFFGKYNKAMKELIHAKNPQRVICLDSAFKGKDEDISNFKLELKDAGIELSII